MIPHWGFLYKFSGFLKLGGFMKDIYLENIYGISKDQIGVIIEQMFSQLPNIHSLLIIPPDYTRCFSYAGIITQMIFEKVGKQVQIEVMPAIGTHKPMSIEEIHKFFGEDIPLKNYFVHHWQTDTIRLGYVPPEFCNEVSEGAFSEAIDVEINKKLFDKHYDLILSIGRVLPHGVVGMANYSKNIFVGVGGREMINKSHIMSAFCGIEKCIGIMNSPVRKVYDYAQQHFIDQQIPLIYILTVTTVQENSAILNGIYIGNSRTPFEM